MIKGERLVQKMLKGLCASCMRRKRCPKAYTYVDLSECRAYKVYGGKKSDKKQKSDK